MQEESDADEEPRFLVRVTGFASKTTKDALLNFFENTRRSGGGEIKDIQLNQKEGFADIIFFSDQDAERVVQNNNLELDGAKLITALRNLPKELPVDQRRLYVVNINDKTTIDGLKSFMEVVSDGEVESILFGSNSDCMVSFQEPVDFHKVQKMCTINSLDDNFLTIEEVKICDCIEVSGLSPNTTKDAIFYYFRNKRNGGGDVKSCEVIDVCKQNMVISFEDPKVLDSIMKQDHMVDGASLTVRRHYPFLGETSLTNPAGAEKYNVVIVDPHTMLFIKEFITQEFDQLLQDHRVNCTWEPGSGEIVLGRAEPKIDKKTWENSCEAVAAYIEQIVTEEISISRETWEQMSDEAKAKCAVYESQISMQHVFDFQTKENSINLRGKKPDVCDLAKQLQDLVSWIEEQIMIEKSKITKKIELSVVQMELMSFSGFLDDIKKKHEGLEVTVISNNSNDQVIQLRGLEEEVNECTVFVWQTLSKVKESEMKFSKSVVSILGSDKGKAFIATSLKNNSIQAIISFDSSSDTHLIVTAMNQDHMNKTMEHIKNAIAEESIHLDPDQKQEVEEEKWKELMHSMQQSMLLQVTEEPATSMLLLVGIKAEVNTAKDKVKKFFDNIIFKRVIATETGCVRFLLEFRQLDMKNIEDSLKKYSVTVSAKSGESDGKIVVSGRNGGIKQAVLRIETLIKSVKDDIIMLDTQKSSEMNYAKDWPEYLREVEKKHSCVIEQCIESKREEPLGLSNGPYGKGFVKIHVFADDSITIQKVKEEIKPTLRDDKNEDAKYKPVQPKISLLKEEEESEQPVQPSRVVRVMGISDKTTKDALLSCFENTRRSGGGEIEDIQHIPEERLADITFYSPDDAERVSQKKCLVLDGSKITVILKEIPKEIPKDPNKLHVTGIGEKTNKDGLESFMEVVSVGEVESTLFGNNSNAIVTFREPPDINRVGKKCSTRALDGSHLKIEQVNICDCIKVTGLAPNTTKDTVLYYFDNRRNGGGEVEKVEMNLDNTRAFVFFKDPSVVNDVTRRRHQINKANLKVAPHYPILGETSSNPTTSKEQKKKDKRKSPANKEKKLNPAMLSDIKTGKKEEEEVCPICLEGLHNPTALPKCKHKFCQKCIELAFRHRKVCPTCGMTCAVQTGNMPPGSMKHYFDHYVRLPGYERYGTIRIDYYFPDGMQSPEHPNPGQRYSGTSRTAYLPDCPEGREVLGLLKKAFDARLTFTIGRSVITGASNAVTWNDIHHKTSTHGGATGFGYPDPTYLQRVKAELAAKGVR